jgi:hypothetical protein
MEKYTYTINDALEVYVYFEGQESPVIYQPHSPDGEPWADKAEATAWADALLAGYAAAEEEAPAEETPTEETPTE